MSPYSGSSPWSFLMNQQDTETTEPQKTHSQWYPNYSHYLTLAPAAPWPHWFTAKLPPIQPFTCEAQIKDVQPLFDIIHVMIHLVVFMLFDLSVVLSFSNKLSQCISLKYIIRHIILHFLLFLPHENWLNQHDGSWAMFKTQCDHIWFVHKGFFFLWMPEGCNLLFTY